MKIFVTVSFSLLVHLSIIAQNLSTNIIIDQFGYLVNSKKIAVIKNPKVGFDASSTYNPGNTFAIVNSNGNSVYESSVISWKSGITDQSSGDQIWHFDFSNITEEGDYYILDLTNNTRSYTFRISNNVYENVLRDAMRTFYYQRVGLKKERRYAGDWEDEASHIGKEQDYEATFYLTKGDPNTKKDVSGGWYDAGDYNKYTTWTANYIIDLIKAYKENPIAFTDDYNIPESGNGIPDIVDEIKWGLDHLLKLQFENGSFVSVVDEDHGSPPSQAKGPTYYGAANTSSTANASAALAYGSHLFKSIDPIYSTNLLNAAENGWNWTLAYPDSIWRNNDAAFNSQGIGAGQQEVDEYTRKMYRLRTSLYLFQATKKPDYKNYFEDHYQENHLIQWNFVYPFEHQWQDMMLEYIFLQENNEAISNNIINSWKNGMNGSEQWNAYDEQKDPYLAHIKDYVWGSNKQKADQGMTFYFNKQYNIDESRLEDAKNAAEGYLHYIHGVNPLSLVYLSNMSGNEAENSITQFFHGWFIDGSTDYDQVGTSTYGPAPGFLVGGPNPRYRVDNCCNNNCGSATNNAVCTSMNLNPPLNQPDQKSYKDFNTNWPLNSWEISENSNGYQVSYIRLLSKFVLAKNILSVTEPFKRHKNAIIYTYLANKEMVLDKNFTGEIKIFSASGRIITSKRLYNESLLDISILEKGLYTVILLDSKTQKLMRLIKL